MLAYLHENFITHWLKHIVFSSSTLELNQPDTLNLTAFHIHGTSKTVISIVAYSTTPSNHTINQNLLEVIRANKFCTICHIRSFTSYVPSLQVPVVAFNNNNILRSQKLKFEYCFRLYN